MRDLVGDSRRKERRDEAQRKLYSLALDQNHVLSAQHGGHGVLDVDEKFKLISDELTVDELRRLFNTRARLQDDIEILLDALADSQVNIDALWRVIEAAGLLGRSLGPPPLQRKLSTALGRGAISAKVQRRLEIIRPLILAEAKINRKGVPKRTFEKANELLIANGERRVEIRTFAEHVSEIIAEDEAAK